MSRDKCVQLLELVRPKQDGVFMRLADGLLEDDEAEALTTQMYELIRSTYTLKAPDQTNHRQALEKSLEYRVTLRERDPSETDGGYRRRMDRVNAWPELSAAIEAKWIWRAQVVISAMKNLHELSRGDYLGLRETANLSFSPEAFYEYSWICLREGHGVQAWNMYGNSPPLPPSGLSIQEKTEWFYNTAIACQKNILTHWHNGETLESLSGAITLESLLSKHVEWKK
ncbi:hypothetical protein N7523_005708 [Penicillium sp. IBT 18751x]|nr:hypothetical protein N7523_005708 [Penicillium sp. IBT 18751x]